MVFPTLRFHWGETRYPHGGGKVCFFLGQAYISIAPGGSYTGLGRLSPDLMKSHGMLALLGFGLGGGRYATALPAMTVNPDGTTTSTDVSDIFQCNTMPTSTMTIVDDVTVQIDLRFPRELAADGSTPTGRTQYTLAYFDTTPSGTTDARLDYTGADFINGGSLKTSVLDGTYDFYGACSLDGNGDAHVPTTGEMFASLGTDLAAAACTASGSDSTALSGASCDALLSTARCSDGTTSNTWTIVQDSDVPTGESTDGCGVSYTATKTFTISELGAIAASSADTKFVTATAQSSGRTRYEFSLVVAELSEIGTADGTVTSRSTMHMYQTDFNTIASVTTSVDSSEVLAPAFFDIVSATSYRSSAADTPQSDNYSDNDGAGMWVTTEFAFDVYVQQPYASSGTISLSSANLDSSEFKDSDGNLLDQNGDPYMWDCATNSQTVTSVGSPVESSSLPSAIQDLLTDEIKNDSSHKWQKFKFTEYCFAQVQENYDYDNEDITIPETLMKINYVLQNTGDSSTSNGSVTFNFGVTVQGEIQETVEIPLTVTVRPVADTLLTGSSTTLYSAAASRCEGGRSPP